VVARASSLEVFAISANPSRFEEAIQWSELARASITRLGGNEELEGDLEAFLGNLYSRADKPEEALTHLERSLQLTDKALGKEHVRRSGTMMTLGIVYRKLGRYDDAIKLFNEAIALREKTSGPTHPQIGSLHYAIAQVLVIIDDYKKALFHAQRSLDIRLATFGPEHPEVAAAYDYVGIALNADQKPKEALEYFLKALAIKEKALGKNHRTMTFSLTGAANSYEQMGQPERALPLYYRALEINQQEQSFRGDAYFGIAQALAQMKGKDADTLDAARKAREAYASVKHPGAKEVDDWLEKRAKSKGKTKTARRP
jgi:tetratricopeptide (TPR) repeat protein